MLVTVNGRRRAIALAAGSILVVLAGVAVACVEFRGAVIAAFLVQGDPAPGTGAAFQEFDRPNISEAGHIAFAGDTDAATDDDVVYADMTLVALEGQAAPGTKGGTYGSFEFFETAQQVNVGGDVAYIATLADLPTTEDRAVYLDDALVAQEGQAAPGIAGRLLVDFGFAGVGNDGRVGFLADLDGATTDDSVIYLDGAVVYRQGDMVPGMAGVTWDGDFDEIQWNGAGDLVFEGNTSLAGGDMVLFLRRNVAGAGLVEEVVVQEGQAVDADGGADFLELFLQSALAENGMWGMRGNLGVAPSTSDAVILTEGGFYTQEGRDVPELPGTVTGNFNGVDINSLGDVLYLADLEGAPPAGVEEGLFINGCLLITDGVQAPGLPEGTLISDIGFETMFINDNRQIVFEASYGGAVAGDGLFTVEFPLEKCPGDIDGTGDVGFPDLLVVLANWGPYEPCPPHLAGDIDLDCEVGFGDLLVVLSSWGPCR
jgi:hypothetical protein